MTPDFFFRLFRDSRGLRLVNVAPDMAIALACYRKAAELRNSNAMLKIASFYLAGDLIKGNPAARDVPQAITWLRQAAHLGDTDAMESLAIISYSESLTQSPPFPGSFDASNSRKERGSTTRPGSEFVQVLFP